MYIHFVVTNLYIFLAVIFAPILCVEHLFLYFFHDVMYVWFLVNIANNLPWGMDSKQTN